MFWRLTRKSESSQSPALEPHHPQPLPDGIPMIPRPGPTTTAAAILALALTATGASRSESADLAQAPTTETSPLTGLDLLRGPWDGGPIHRESLLFVKGSDGKPAAKLLYDVERALAVASASGKTTYEARRDYRITPDGSGLELTSESRIPFLDESDLFRPKDAAYLISGRPLA